MIIRTQADNAYQRKRLSDVLTGERAVIVRSENPIIDRRMMVLGLIDGVEVEIETRDRRGDLVLITEGKRFHILAHYAKKIWVDPITQGNNGGDVGERMMT